MHAVRTLELTSSSMATDISTPTLSSESRIH
jgi:hypothetical protein